MENRTKMSQAERAKQFMPFAALKGYHEALRRKEEIVVTRTALTEEQQAALSLKLRQVRKNDIVTVVYFCKDRCLEQTGVVVRIDETARILRIVNTKIAFDDICDISGDKISEESSEI